MKQRRGMSNKIRYAKVDEIKPYSCQEKSLEVRGAGAWKAWTCQGMSANQLPAEHGASVGIMRGTPHLARVTTLKYDVIWLELNVRRL